MENKNVDINLPLAAFLAELEKKGFDISVHTHMHLQIALREFGPEYFGRVEKIKTILCPLVAKNRVEQEKFYQLFDEYLLGVLEKENIEFEALQRNAAAVKEQKAKKATKKSQLLKRSLLAIAGISLLIFLCILIFTPYKLFNKPTLDSFPITTPDLVESEELVSVIDTTFVIDTVIEEEKKSEKKYRKSIQVEKDSLNAEYERSHEPTSDDCKNLKPAAYFQIYPQSEAMIGDTIFITNNSPAGDSLRFTWNFGDNSGLSFSKKNKLSHVFQKPGTYTIALNVSSYIVLCDSTYFQTISIASPQEAVAEVYVAKEPSKLPYILMGLLGFSILLGFAIYILWARTKEEMLRYAVGNIKPPFTLEFTSQDEKLQAMPAIFSIAKSMRERSIASTNHFDAKESMRKTIRKGGYPEVVFNYHSQPSEFLILIDQHSPQDHQAKTFWHLMKNLQQEDVLLETFYFQQTPRFCWNEKHARGIGLDHLFDNFPNHKLLIFSEGNHFLDPKNGQLKPWISKQLGLWKERVLFNPKIVEQWNFRERVLGGFFTLLPATIAGQLTLVSALKKREEKFNFQELKKQNQEQQNPNGVKNEVFTKMDFTDISFLKYYLGSSLFSWLCALSIYPKLNWDLTLAIGKKLGQYFRDTQKEGEALELLSHENLLKLSSVPWLKTGDCPQVLLHQLEQQLHRMPEVEKISREVFANLLSETEIPEDAFVYQEKALQLRLQKAYFKKQQWKNSPRRLLTLILGTLLLLSTLLGGGYWFFQKIKAARYQHAIETADTCMSLADYICAKTAYLTALENKEKDSLAMVGLSRAEFKLATIEYDSVYTFHEGFAVVQKDSFFGFVNHLGASILPLEYDTVHPFKEQRAAVVKDSLFGFIDTTGRVVIPLKYKGVESFEYIELFHDTVAWFQKDSTYGFVNKVGKEQDIPLDYEEVGKFVNGLARVRKGGKVNNYGTVIGGKYGYVNLKGERIVPLDFDQANHFQSGVAVVGKFGKYGLINSSGQALTPIKYEYITRYGSLFEATLNNKHGVLDLNGVERIPLIYSYVGLSAYDKIGLIEVHQGQNEGMVDLEGQIRIPIKYYLLHEYEEKIGGMVAKLGNNKGGKYGVIDTTDKAIIPFVYDEFNYYSDDRTIVKVLKDKKYGLLNLATQKEILPIKYGYLEYYTDLKWASVKEGEKYGVLDVASQKVMIPLQYDGLSYVKTHGLFKVQKNGKFGVIDKKNSTIIPLEYEKLEKINGLKDIKKDYYYMVKDQKWGIMDFANQSTFIPLEYDKMSLVNAYAENILFAVKGAKWGIIGVQPKQEGILPFVYDSLAYWSKEKMYWAKKEGKVGFVDINNKVLIPFEFDDISKIAGGLMLAKKNGLYGYVDESFKTVIDFKYSLARDFYDDLAYTKEKGQDYFIDKSGQRIFKAFKGYGCLRSTTWREGLMQVGTNCDEKTSKWGFANKQGEIVIPLRYEEVGSFYNGQARVKLDGKSFYIDKTGKCVKDCD